MTELAMSFGPSTETMPIARRIADCLRAARLTAKEIARKAGVSPRTVENWRTGTTSMSAETLIRLCAEMDEVWQEVRALAGRAETPEDAARVIAEMARLLNERRG